MTYPSCPNNTPDKCRFTDEGSMLTLMHSPIVRDREGNPVSGGHNRITCVVRCHACGNLFSSFATELADAQGKPREWKKI